MAERKFIYLSPTTGDEGILHESLDADYPKGSLPASLINLNTHRMVCSDANRTPVGISITTNQLVGRLTGGISGLTATDVRTLINVQDGATYTNGRQLIANDTVNQIYNIYDGRTDSGSGKLDTLNFKAIKPASVNRCKVTTTSTAVNIDPMITPHTYNAFGNSNIYLGALFPCFRLLQQRLQIISVHVITDWQTPGTTGQKLGIYLLKNTTRSLTGASAIADARSFANAIDDYDGAGNGFMSSSDGRWIGNDILNTDEWLLMQISNKWLTSGNNNGANILTLHVSFRFAII